MGTLAPSARQPRRRSPSPPRGCLSLTQQRAIAAFCRERTLPALSAVNEFPKVWPLFTCTDSLKKLVGVFKE